MTKALAAPLLIPSTIIDDLSMTSRTAQVKRSAFRIIPNSVHPKVLNLFHYNTAMLRAQ
jgi:hypothetical protein